MLNLYYGTPNTPWWRGGLVTSDAPPDLEMNLCSVPSTSIQVEARGENVYRLLYAGKWGDFRLNADGSAVYVAGTIETGNDAELEGLAANLIVMEAN